MVMQMKLIVVVNLRRFEDSEIVENLSEDDDDCGGSENVGKTMNLHSFKLNHIYLDPLNMSNAGDFSWS